MPYYLILLVGNILVLFTFCVPRSCCLKKNCLQLRFQSKNIKRVINLWRQIIIQNSLENQMDLITCFYLKNLFLSDMHLFLPSLKVENKQKIAYFSILVWTLWSLKFKAPGDYSWSIFTRYGFHMWSIFQGMGFICKVFFNVWVSYAKFFHSRSQYFENTLHIKPILRKNYTYETLTLEKKQFMNKPQGP